MSGMSTAGESLTININGLGTSASIATSIVVLLWHNALTELQDGSCQLSV